MEDYVQERATWDELPSSQQARYLDLMERLEGKAGLVETSKAQQEIMALRAEIG